MLDRGINNFTIFFVGSRTTSVILGNSHDKTFGKTMVLHRSWRNNTVDHHVGYDSGSKSDMTNGRALSINSMSIVTELFEIAFIIITAIIISKERTKRAPEIKQESMR